ncbi:MAG: hypothetical protein QM499_01030 [Flavobacteriaceae bacterium]
MGFNKEKIRLVATSIAFTSHSIVYGVKIEGDINCSGISVSLPSIKHKDLIMKSTIVDANNMEVIFTAINVTPHFYQAIHKKLLRNLSEYGVEMNKIYSVGEVVAYLVPL